MTGMIHQLFERLRLFGCVFGIMKGERHSCRVTIRWLPELVGIALR